jgi:hypothetical protein
MAVVTFIGVTSGIYIFTPIVDNLKQQVRVRDKSEKRNDRPTSMRKRKRWGLPCVGLPWLPLWHVCMVCVMVDQAGRLGACCLMKATTVCVVLLERDFVLCVCVPSVHRCMPSMSASRRSASWANPACVVRTSHAQSRSRGARAAQERLDAARVVLNCIRFLSPQHQSDTNTCAPLATMHCSCALRMSGGRRKASSSRG